MFSIPMLILRDPSLRIMTLALFLTGFTAAATMPYFSIVATREFGLSNSWLSILTFAMAVGNLVFGVSLSVKSDTIRDRRWLIIFANAAGVIGYGLIYALPSRGVFLFCSMFLVTISGSSFALLFGAVRSKSNLLEPGQAAPVNSTIRAVFSGSWILVPGIVALLLVNSQSMLPAWGFASAACAAGLLLTLFFLPPTTATPSAATARIGFFASLQELLTPVMLVRILFLALVVGTSRLIMILAPLIIVESSGGLITDVGFVAGGTAALEIPFMLMWAGFLRRYKVIHVLAAGSIIYAAFMVALGFATAPWHIYALILPSACGAAAILSLPMTYLQDLVADRPGLGTSLYQMTTFASFVIVSIVFAAGATSLGYSATAWLGAAMALLGICGLLALGRGGPMVHSSAKPS